MRPGRYIYLLLALITLMVLTPLVEGTICASLIGAAYIAILLSTVFALSKRHILWVASLILAAPATMGAIAHDLDWDSAYPFLFYAPMIAFCIFAIVTIFVVKVGASEEVTPDTIAAAACIYMLLGITWSLIFTALLLNDPTAITGIEFVERSPSILRTLAGYGPRPGLIPRNSDVTYFSFVTLTTLGYGDFQPVKPLVRTFTILEATMGVLYVAVVVARLVGLYRSGSRSSDGSGSRP
jgi:hypothetical protein